MLVKRVSRGGQCGYKRNPLERCRRRTRQLYLILAHMKPAYYRGHVVGEDLVQTHWEFRCSNHKDK